MLGQRADAEDAAQEALTRFFKKIPELGSSGEARAYLCRLALNEARRIRAGRWFRVGRSATELQDDLTGDDPSPEQEAHFTDVYRKVESLVPRLSRRERQVFLLRAFEDLGYDEIASILKVSQVTVRRQFSLARQRMVRLLRDEMGIELEFPD